MGGQQKIYFEIFTSDFNCQYWYDTDMIHMEKSDANR